METTLLVCNKLIYQDDSHARCYLEVDHPGGCQEQPNPRKLDVRPHRERSYEMIEDIRYKSISNGNGIYFTVPTWVTEILQRHADEIV